MNLAVFEAVRRLIVDAFAGVTAYDAPTVILANQQNPKLSGDFVTVLPMIATAQGWPISNLYTAADDLVEKQSKLELWTISVNCFSQAGNAVAQMRRILAYLKSQRGATLAQALKIGFCRASPPQDLSALQGGVFESRSQSDIQFYIASVEEFSLGAVDTVTVEGTINEPNADPAPVILELDVIPPNLTP